MGRSFLITEWNRKIGQHVAGGDLWKKTGMFEVSEKDAWEYVLDIIDSLAQGNNPPHFSIKELTSKISTRSTT